MILQEINPLGFAEFLKYGLIGLGAIIAILAFQLIKNEQANAAPRKAILNSIYVFMVFGVIICLIGVFAPKAESQSHQTGSTVAESTTPGTTATLVPPEPELTAIILLPNSKTVSPKETIHFTSTGIFNGSKKKIDVNYTATDGKIDDDGNYTAPDYEGVFSIIATSSDKPINATAKISVVLPKPSKQAQLYGGPNGSEFDDLYNIPKEGRISGVLINHGDLIDDIRFIWNGSLSPIHGLDKGGTPTNINFASDEYIIAISGYAGRDKYQSSDVICSISIQTNKRSIGPYGMQAPNNFSLSAQNNYEIVGLHGRSGRFLNAVGIIVRKRIPD